MEAIKSQSECGRQRRWWHWQNLNDGTGRKEGWLSGRCWWHLLTGVVRLEWTIGKIRFGLTVDISDEDVTFGFCVPLLSLYFSLDSSFPWLKRLLPHRPLEYYPDTIVVDERSIGVRIHGNRIWFEFWGRRNESRSSDPWWIRGISFQLNPFEWRHQAHEVWRELDTIHGGGYWVPFVGSWEIGHPSALNKFQAKEPDQRTEWALPYRYVLKNGTAQDRIATVHIERWSSRPLCLRWARLFERTRQSIAVSFNDEVGEESGSWKGGCTGCGFELLPGETAEQSLRRMEATRKF